MSQGRSPSGFSRQRSSVPGELISAAMFLVVLSGVVAWIFLAYVFPPRHYAGVANPKSPLVNVQMASNRPMFAGTVVDALTHQPVDAFIVMVGYKAYPNPLNIIYNPAPQTP